MSSVANTSKRRKLIDWRRRDVRDAIVTFGIAVAVFAGAQSFETLEGISAFARRHAELGLDGLITLLIVLSLAGLVFGWRRIQDLNREIAARRAAEQRADALARHDPLTGLPNHRFFIEKLDDILRQTKAEGKRVAVLMLDLNGIKTINDAHGHDHGDKVLLELAARVSAALSDDDSVARVGGTDFAIIQPRIRSIDNPTRLARRLVVCAGEPFAVAGTPARLGVHIGIAVAPDDGTAAEELMRRAALALQRAKADGRSSVRFFEPEMDGHVEKRMRIERELETAIATSAVAVHYQPIVSLVDDAIVGFEALARWKSPKLGWVPPSWFISVAEECGLIRELGDQLLRRACRDACSWPAELKLALNVSSHQLRDRALGLRILSILGETGLNPHRLELEIPESALVGDIDIARQVIGELRRAGVRVALDDFGAGSATVSQLLAVQFDKIKIAAGIVHRLGKDPNSAVIVRAMIGLAGALGLSIAAKAIEKPEQLAQLAAAGYAEGQGFLFGTAVPPTEVPAVLRRAARPGASRVRPARASGMAK